MLMSVMDVGIDTYLYGPESAQGTNKTAPRDRLDSSASVLIHG